MLCNPKFDNDFLGHVISVVSGPTIFDFPTPIFNHFHNKIVSAQRSTCSIQIFYTVLQTTCLEGIFYVRRVLDPCFFMSSQVYPSQNRFPMSYMSQNILTSNQIEILRW